MNRWYAVYAVDPGGVSGVGRGVFDMRGDTTAEVVREAFEQGRAETWEARGNAAEQSHEIAAEWLDWRDERLLQDGLEAELVVEDFHLRPGMKSDARLVYPLRIAGALDLVAIEKGHAITYQQPSQAMTYATNARLKRWGLWTPSSRDHRRDALRHLCLAVSKKLQ